MSDNKPVLLVEDNEMNRDMMIRRLNRAGLEVIAAGDGQQALDLMISEQPAVVLMDMNLPVMDGWEAGQRMREIAPLLPKLWSGDWAHEGEFFQVPATTSAPKPVQAGGPPIWIAARDPNSHKFGVQNGFNIQVTPLWQGMAEIETLIGRFNEACANFDGPRPKIMLLHHTYVGRDDADLTLSARELSRFYCYLGAWFQNNRPV